MRYTSYASFDVRTARRLRYVLRRVPTFVRDHIKLNIILRRAWKVRYTFRAVAKSARYRVGGPRAAGTVHGPTDDRRHRPRGTCRRITSSSRRRAPRSVAEHYTAQSTAPPCHRAARVTHSGARSSATDQRGLRRPPTQDKTLTNHSNHQARSPRHKQASPRGTNHRHKASSHPHVAISSSNRRARPRAESPTPHLNLAMLLHGGITASRSS